MAVVECDEYKQQQTIVVLQISSWKEINNSWWEMCVWSFDVFIEMSGRCFREICKRDENFN
jgi:hypothetical protein